MLVVAPRRELLVTAEAEQARAHAKNHTWLLACCAHWYDTSACLGLWEFPTQHSVPPMSLMEAVQAPRVSLILLPFLRWQDCLSLGAVSTLSFNSVKVWVEERSTDISSGASPYPIPCESSCHRRAFPARRSESSRGWCIGGPLPPSFKYLNESVHLVGAPNSGASDLLQGCSCQTACKEDDEDGSPCPCVQLNASVQSGSAPLFECHAGCSCGAECRLRATQAGGGRAVPRMRLRHMGRKGWGAYSIDALAEGTFVADYTGEALPVEEARKRVPAYDQEGLNYVLTTQEFFQEGKVVWQTIVDATTSGNVSRFFNHSCEPTLSVFVIRRGSFLPRLAFFTLGNLAAGDELTYDYGAAGSAGGTSEEGNREGSFEPMPKAQRRIPPTDTIGNCSDGDASSLGEGVSTSGKELAGSRSRGGSADGDAHGDALRRLCLCGSRRCRGFLPCNRAIL